MKKVAWYFAAAAITASVAGCSNIPLPPSFAIDQSIQRHDAVRRDIALGSSKEQVLTLLQPTHADLPSKWGKDPDRFLRDGISVEIHYFYSQRIADGAITDDEFTPYIFENGVLVGIGWAILGGPKTQGRATTTVSSSSPEDRFSEIQAENERRAAQDKQRRCDDALRRQKLGVGNSSEVSRYCGS